MAVARLFVHEATDYAKDVRDSARAGFTQASQGEAGLRTQGLPDQKTQAEVTETGTVPIERLSDPEL